MFKQLFEYQLKGAIEHRIEITVIIVAFSV